MWQTVIVYSNKRFLTTKETINISYPVLFFFQNTKTQNTIVYNAHTVSPNPKLSPYRIRIISFTPDPTDPAAINSFASIIKS